MQAFLSEFQYGVFVGQGVQVFVFKSHSGKSVAQSISLKQATHFFAVACHSGVSSGHGSHVLVLLFQTGFSSVQVIFVQK